MSLRNPPKNAMRAGLLPVWVADAQVRSPGAEVITSSSSGGFGEKVPDWREKRVREGSGWCGATVESMLQQARRDR